MYRYQLLTVEQIMKGYNETEIIPNCNRSQKSFYGKARQITLANGDKYLQSYETIVARIDNKGEFTRLWWGWSATTAKHIDSFRRSNGLPGIGKAEWEKLPVNDQ